ncbi:MAG: matrixin family metalloprotease [Patescibacteria group bacterium]
MRRSIDIVVLVAALGVAGYWGYFHQEEVRVIAHQLKAKVFPCRSPITYSLGSIDKRFGISEKSLVADLVEAESIWEKSSDKDLFEYAVSGGDVTVNLVYDERQASTDRLQDVGIQIDRSKSTYDTLKQKYDSLSALVEAQQAQYQRDAAAYKIHESAYNAEVASWNTRGGAPPRVYEQLEQKKAVLQREVEELNMVQGQLNSNIQTLNALATTLNQLIVQLNLNVEQYNQAGAAQGEFEEGVYESSAGKQKIDIYEYSSRSALVRVLAHEMGHVLGVEHVADPEAIMYKINQGKNMRLAQDDITALNAQCSSGSFQGSWSIR